MVASFDFSLWELLEMIVARQWPCCLASVLLPTAFVLIGVTLRRIQERKPRPRTDDGQEPPA